ncbi:MAG: hypothetical protein H0V41_03650 [Pseudonocardiales bacterium]|nr:hypothetical protein [Pseudonocardiales bacterium]
MELAAFDVAQPAARRASVRSNAALERVARGRPERSPPWLGAGKVEGDMLPRIVALMCKRLSLLVPLRGTVPHPDWISPAVRNGYLAMFSGGGLRWPSCGTSSRAFTAVVPTAPASRPRPPRPMRSALSAPTPWSSTATRCAISAVHTRRAPWCEWHLTGN